MFLEEYISDCMFQGRLGGLTIDNASNMVTLGMSIDMHWAPCFAYVTNLFIKDVFGEAAIKYSLNSQRELVTISRTSQCFIVAESNSPLKRGSPERTFDLAIRCESPQNVGPLTQSGIR